MRFDDLRLHEPILRAVRAAGYLAPTPIQAQAIPHVLAGRDVLGCAQTGTGKTAAFALPILQRLAEQSGPAGGRSRSGPRCLVLCPTRELAQQIHDSFRDYGVHTGLRAAVIFGGVNQGPQVRALRSGVDVLVATPGRLLDLLGQKLVDLRPVGVLVLDEADRMFDMGFLPDLRRILAVLPGKRQNLLFSATMPDPIRRLAADVLRQPAVVQVARVSSAASTVEHWVHFVEKPEKASLLVNLLRDTPFSRALVFTRTKHGADKLVRVLVKAGLPAAAIHGNKSQNARTRALAEFRSAKTPVLVATDIAARGIDVDDVTHVFNYDLTTEPETYVHRIGRTGRAGAAGVAVSFCTAEEGESLRAIERLIRTPLRPASGTPRRAATAVPPAPARLTDRPGRTSRPPRPSPVATVIAEAPASEAPKRRSPHGWRGTPRRRGVQFSGR
jgi:ATP-dependent RNA helicase RhlE